jgi:hypothetical protein
MVRYTCIAAQRLASRGEVAVSCSGLPGLVADAVESHDLGRWRS